MIAPLSLPTRVFLAKMVRQVLQAPLDPPRVGRGPGGVDRVGNSQPLVLRLQLPVHRQREAEKAPGVPSFLDHIVLAGVQVEGGAEPRQEPH